MDAREATVNLKRDAESLRKATIENDYQRIADLTFAALVEGVGGREKYIEHLKAMDQKFTVRLTAIRLAEPGKPVESRGEYYAILPYQLDVTWPNGKTGHVPTFFVGVSGDGGRKWTFIDGAGVAGNRTKLLKIMPGFPEALALPDRQEIVED